MANRFSMRRKCPWVSRGISCLLSDGGAGEISVHDLGGPAFAVVVVSAAVSMNGAMIVLDCVDRSVGRPPRPRRLNRRCSFRRAENCICSAQDR